MTAFYVFIILLGSFVTAIALVLIVMEKTRSHDYRLDVTERRDRLVDTMDDADELVRELNRFSDYVVTTCEEKKREVEQVIFQADRLVGQVASTCAVLESALAASHVKASSVQHQLHVDPLEEEQGAQTGIAEESAPSGRGRVLSLDARRQEALRLARKGMAHAEIARSLQLGKGEIELIARMGNQP